MEPFQYNGRQIDFKAVTGQVRGAHKHAETIVKGKGGGGINGNVEPIHIECQVVIKQEFFLKSGTGKDVSFKLQDEDIPLAENQNITMVSGQIGKKVLWPLLVNHDAELYWRLGNLTTQAIEWGLVRNPGWILLIGIAIWVGTAHLLNGWAGFLAAVSYWMFEWLIMRTTTKALKGHLDGLGSKFLRSGTAVS